MTDLFEPVIGRRSPEEAAKLLRDVGEDTLAGKIEAGGERRATTYGAWLQELFGGRLWSYTTHAFGYIAPHEPNARGGLPIAHAGNIKPDATLKNQQIKITLNWLRVADYPGAGVHRILFDFYARNQTTGPDADLHFNSTYRVRQGQQAGILGYPIFVGVNVGQEGLAFRCYTVNVKNDGDEAFLDFLESDSFRQGLEITKAAQPALRPFAEMALGLTKTLAKRHRNVPVQDVTIGLDFSSIPGRARLAEGAYIAMQVQDELHQIWNWEDWVYDPTSGAIVSRDDRSQGLPYNYFVLGISRMG